MARPTPRHSAGHGASNEAPAWFRWLVVATLGALFLGAMAYAIASNVEEEDSSERYYDVADETRVLRSIHKERGEPQENEWLAMRLEMGQTFDQYVSGRPILPTDERNKMFILPLGGFTEEQRRIVALSTEFLGLYYGLPCEALESVEDSVVPDFARREWGYPQFSTPFLLQKVLKPRLPDDAMFLMAFTATDLWPGREGWNFVFGQASLAERVGVWSIKRFGDPAESPEAFTETLRRSLKTASHEAGHMFGIKHCVAYECGMAGSLGVEEADGRPLEVCPECLAKILWATNYDAAARFRALADFCGRHGLNEERAFYEKSLATLEAAAAK